LQQHPKQDSTTWGKLYHRLDTSLNRLDTLAELARWEESPTTQAALSYQQSREEEIGLVIQLLNRQVTEALASAQQGVLAKF
jgi:hypothetical protein